MTSRLDPDSMPVALATLLSGTRTSDVLASVNEDDCAAVAWQSPLLVATTDFVNSNPISLELGVGDLSTVGRLVVATNVSDLLGSGALPRFLLLSVMMPRDSTTEDFLRLMTGARHEAARWGVQIIGGDTKLGKSLSVSGTAIGECQSENQLFLKNRAKAGDDIWISGSIGGCSAAVLGLRMPIQDPAWRKWAIETLTVPELPLVRSAQLSRLGLACSGTDISDGLGMDLLQLCELSKVGATIIASQIPTEAQVAFAAEQLSLQPWNFSFALGGDFQFLVTASPQHRDSIDALGFTRIGRITSESVFNLELPNGVVRPLPTDGHKDGKRLSFTDEVRALIDEVNRV